MSTLRSQSSRKQEEEEGGAVILPILPRDILMEIGKRNPSRLDASRIRSVCRSWRRSLPPPFRFPIKIPPPPGPTDEYEDNATYFITEVTFYAANRMILSFEEDYRGGGFGASVLLQSSARTHLQGPDPTKLELPPWSELSGTLSFLCNAYHIHNAYPRFSRRNYRHFGKSDFYCNFNVLKTVIVSSDASIRNMNYAPIGGLKAVAHLYDRKLAVLRLGGGVMSNHWETGFCDLAFVDIVHFKGRLYAVDKFGQLFVMCSSSLHMTKVAKAVCFVHTVQGNGKALHLVASEDELYMFSHDHRALVFHLGSCSGFSAKPRLYKLISSSAKHQYSCCWAQADHDLPDQVFVQDVRCNFHVARDLIPVQGMQVPRFCAYPAFEFFRASVGVKNRHKDPPFERLCFLRGLPYYNRPQ